MEFPKPFFLASMQRTGSHLLMSLLDSTKYVGELGESLQQINSVYHSRREIGEDVSNLEILNAFRDIYNRTTKDLDKVPWGMKITVDSLFVVERFLELVEIEPKELKWIWLWRRNKVRQALSHIRASVTGVASVPVNSPQEHKCRAKMKVDIDEQELLQRTVQFILFDQVWENFFKLNEINPYTVIYEDFIDPLRWEGMVKGILDFLEVDYKSPLNVSTWCTKMSKDDELPAALMRLILIQ